MTFFFIRLLMCGHLRLQQLLRLAAYQHRPPAVQPLAPGYFLPGTIHLGVSSAIISGVKFGNNRTAGNFLILVADIALTTAGPIGGIASGLLETLGAKDAIGAALDERLEYDNFISQTNQNKAKR